MNERFPRVGIIGAGQLARMMVAPATSLGIDLLLFAQSADDSGAQIAHHVIGDFTDLEALKKFAATCDVVTYERNKNSMSSIRGLAAAGVKIYPSLMTLEKCPQLVRPYVSPTNSLKQSDHENLLAVTMARSAHGQATSWAPTEIFETSENCRITISPAQNFSESLAQEAQRFALEIGNEINLIGVATVVFSISSGSLVIKEITQCPHSLGNWTVDGSRTSQFEQHLRAILDLPLGDPSLLAEFAVSGEVACGEKKDFYRPYLHLMARNPDLKIHQYRTKAEVGNVVGHVTAIGNELEKLKDEILHALDYMSAKVDE